MVASTVFFYHLFDNNITKTLGAAVCYSAKVRIHHPLNIPNTKKFFTKYSAAEAVGLTEEEAARMTTGQALLTIIARKKEKARLAALKEQKKKKPVFKYYFKDGKLERSLFVSEEEQIKKFKSKSTDSLLDFTQKQPYFNYERLKIKAPKDIHKRYGNDKISYFEFVESVRREQEFVSTLPHLQLPSNPLEDGTIEIPQEKPKYQRPKDKISMIEKPHIYIRYNPRRPPYWFGIPRKVFRRYRLNFKVLKNRIYPTDSRDFASLSTGQYKIRAMMVRYKKRVKFFYSNLQKITKKRKRRVYNPEVRLLLGKKLRRRSSLFVRYINSPKGIGYYKTMLRIFRRKNLKFFLRYKSVIVPLLRKRFKIKKTNLRLGKKQKRLQKFYQLRYAVSVFRKKTMLQYSKQYKFFLMLQQGLRFIYGKFSRKDLKDIYLNAKKETKMNQFVTFYFNFYRNLAMSLIITSFLPKLINAKQFIRNRFVVVNGQICQNYIRFLNLHDIVEIHKFMYLLLFIRGKNAEIFKSSLYRPVVYMPFFIKNYRVLMFIYARNLNKGNHLFALRLKPLMMLTKKKAFAFFFKSFIRFFPL